MILVTVTTGIIMYNYDYVPNARFLLDFEGFTLVDLFKVNVRDLFKLVRICEVSNINIVLMFYAQINTKFVYMQSYLRENHF